MEHTDRRTPDHEAEEMGHKSDVTIGDLSEVLRAHKKWIESKGDKGTRANLQETNLREADLSYVHLQEAILQKACLNEANLRYADLSHTALERADLRNATLDHANLYQANLRDSELWQANLEYTNLQNADLTGAKGLLTSQLRGSDLSGARLPESSCRFEGLRHIEELSNHAQKLFLTVILSCVYMWITIGTTKDARLLANSASSPLPIIGAEIPIVGFYWTAPLLLFSLYLWFQLHLQRLWKEFADMPAYFPDGSALMDKAHPWLLNSIVEAHFERLRPNRTFLAWLEVSLSNVLAYWVAPATLLLVWTRYLPRHDWTGTFLHIALLAFATTTAFIFHRLAAITLGGQKRNRFTAQATRKAKSAYSCLAGFLGFFGTAFFFYVLSYGAIEGARPKKDIEGLSDLFEQIPHGVSLSEKIKVFVPCAFEFAGYVPFATIDSEDISTRPSNSEGGAKTTMQAKGANLEGGDFRYANASGAFFAKANLTKAKLQNTDLRLANLEQSELRQAKLDNACLQWANLQGAKLERASLANAKLMHATVIGASLADANLNNANLCEASLEESYWYGANLQFANLQGANLGRAKLTGADLQGASLKDADLHRAILYFAKLKDADLSGTNLETTEGLTQAQIDTACGVDAKTKLPPGINRPVPKPCPNLSRPLCTDRCRAPVAG